MNLYYYNNINYYLYESYIWGWGSLNNICYRVRWIGGR